MFCFFTGSVRRGRRATKVPRSSSIALRTGRVGCELHTKDLIHPCSQEIAVMQVQHVDDNVVGASLPQRVVRVCVADDSWVQRQLMRRKLQGTSMGYALSIELVDSAEAVRTRWSEFDILIVDNFVGETGASGVDVLQQIHSQAQEGNDAKFIILWSAEEVESAMGADDIWPKNITRSDVEQQMLHAARQCGLHTAQPTQAMH